MFRHVRPLALIYIERELDTGTVLSEAGTASEIQKGPGCIHYRRWVSVCEALETGVSE